MPRSWRSAAPARSLQYHELRGATLYSTLQPCGMCTMATIWAKIGRIVFGAGRDDVHPMYFEDRHLDTLDFIRDAYRDDLMLQGGVLAAECAALYVPPRRTGAAGGAVQPLAAPRLASGATNCGSVSQGNMIQVSCDTSVTKVSTTSRAAGLA